MTLAQRCGYDPRDVSHSIVHASDLPFIERPYRPQDKPRQVASLTEALGLENARASVWRYPPGARGRRRREGAQDYLVGSTVERIVRHSPVPVLVIK